ncbi:MAG: F-box protein [Chlamydiales bacterium]|nr:F-box protein [Chlamydiales bacterium]
MSIAQVSPELPSELWCAVVSHIEDDRDVAKFSLVCKLFKAVVDIDPTARLRRLGIYDFAFGKAKWKKYFGDVGDEPPLPSDIDQILNGPCPIWDAKKVRETHMLTLIPSHVNGEQLTLESIGELVKSPKGEGFATEYYLYNNPHGNEKAHVNQNTWVLMTRNVLPDSREKSYNVQRQLVAKLAQKSGQPYEVPRLIEAVTSIFMEYIKTGARLYGKDPWEFTRCQEMTQDDITWPMDAGGFAAGGLEIGSHWDNGSYGVGGARKF